MNDEKIVDTLIEIKTQLAETNANLKNFQAILANHENRLCQVEKEERTQAGGWKADVIQWLIKALIGAIAVIVALTGSGTALKSLLGAG